MRELIINKIETIKNSESGFLSSKWESFFVGALHLSEVCFKGMPDELLLDLCIEIERWNQYGPWTCDKIVQWLKDVEAVYEDINEKEEYEGREQLNFLISSIRQS